MILTHPNYHSDLYNGVPVYRCCACDHDTFNLDNAVAHQRDSHRPVNLDYDRIPWLTGLHITVGTISSQSDAPGIYRHLAAVAEEVFILQRMGALVTRFWVNNGGVFDGVGAPSVFFPENRGQSVARNLMIERSLHSDLLIMVDGDIAPVYRSFAQMAHWMRCNTDPAIGCLGIYSRNCSSNPLDVDSQCPLLTSQLVHDKGRQMAWTQYGIFNTEMFRAGIRFDESPCFQGEGWGVEDDDLYCQMLDKGYRSVHTKYLRYGHYNRNSSLRAMDPTLAAKVLRARQLHVYGKWSANPRTATYVAHMLNQTMPVLT